MPWAVGTLPGGRGAIQAGAYLIWFSFCSIFATGIAPSTRWPSAKNTVGVQFDIEDDVQTLLILGDGRRITIILAGRRPAVDHPFVPGLGTIRRTPDLLRLLERILGEDWIQENIYMVTLSSFSISLARRLQ